MYIHMSTITVRKLAKFVSIVYNEIYTHLKWPVSCGCSLDLAFQYLKIDAAGQVMLQLGVNNTKAMPEKKWMATRPEHRRPL